MSLPTTRSAREKEKFSYTNGKTSVNVNLTGGSASEGGTYEAKQFVVATGTTDYDVDANQADLFADITTAKYVSIRTNQTITIKFNSASDDGIEVTTTDSPYTVTPLGLGIGVTNIYISNASGSTATIDIEIS